MAVKNEALTLENLVLEITTHNIHEEQLKDRPSPPNSVIPRSADKRDVGTQNKVSKFS